MPIDFPNTPSVGQQFSVGGNSWTWSGSVWDASVTTVYPGKFVASVTEPENLQEGQGWFDPTTGKFFVYYNDSWVEIAGGGGSGSISVSETAPEDANEGDLWFNSVDTNTYIYYDSFWVQASDSKAGPAGADGASGVAFATSPITYNAETKTVGVDDTAVITTASQTLTNKTLTSARLSGTTSIEQILEDATIVASSATATINYDVLANNAITFYTGDSAANWTLNVRGDSTNTLNSIMDIGQSLTIVFVATNGTTAYYQAGLQIDGQAITPKWQGGTAPTAGNASSLDSYSITIIKTADAQFNVLESQVRFA